MTILTDFSGRNTKPVGELCEAFGGGTPSKGNAEYWIGEIPWVSPKDMKTWNIVNSEDRISPDALDSGSCKLVDPPAVLLVVRGMILARTIPVGVSRVPVTINQDMKILKPKPGVDADYLAYMIKAAESELLRRVDIAGHGTRRLSTEKWSSLPIPLPLLPEQLRVVERIRSLFEVVDEISTLRATSKSEVDRLRQSFLGEVEKSPGLQLLPVSEVIRSSKNGRSIASSGQQPTGSVLTLTAVREVSLDVRCHKVVPLNEQTSRDYSFSSGDVFVSRSNTRDLVGLSAVSEQDAPSKMIFPDLLIKLEADRSKILPRYLAYALRFPSVRQQIKAHAKGTSQSMVKITGASLRLIEIPVPRSLDEQEEAVEQLDSRMALTQSIADAMIGISADTFKQSVLIRAYQGEL